MERMEHLIRFTSCDWYNDPTVTIVLVENTEPIEILEAPKYESHLNDLGLCMGLTSESTSESYHQNIVGVEGWLVNLADRNYTRLDRFELNWLNREKGYLKLRFDELVTFMNDRPGQAHGKSFGI